MIKWKAKRQPNHKLDIILLSAKEAFRILA